MRRVEKRAKEILILFVGAAILAPGLLWAQYPPYGTPPPPAPYGPPPPLLPPAELDRLVAPVALYPDPLLTQVLTASTFYDEIPQAAAWADQHSYLHGDQLAAAISADNLPWDPSVIALLPFPSVLGMMARDMAWTTELGNAFLSQPGAVMDAVQRLRQQALSYGYLVNTPQVQIVRSGPYVEILPVSPGVIYVPVYNPAVVFVPRRPGFHVTISFGAAVVVGAFRPWGWAEPHFSWPSRTVIIDNHPWQRTWANRREYVHPYRVAPLPAARRGPPVERHELRGHAPAEKGRVDRGQNGRDRGHGDEDHRR